MRKTTKERYHERRNKAYAYLGGKCVRCGSTERLEFDHIDQTKKTMEMVKCLDVPFEVFWAELQKCQLLCKKCHIKKTIEENHLHDTRTQHGFIAAYTRRKCRCSLCRLAWSTYMKQKRNNDKLNKEAQKVII
jgi:5-methylcytosine-specific restriction endonuclease McrA